MPTTRRSSKQKGTESIQSPIKKTSPKNRKQEQENQEQEQKEQEQKEKQEQKNIEKPCYILLYKCYNNDNMLVPIYIDEQLGNTFINNMDLVKIIQIKTKTIITYATLQYAKKCCKQVYNFMSKMNSKIYPELSSRVFEKLGGVNLILPLFDENDQDFVFDYELEKKKQIESENIFKFDWDMDELTKTETTWDLIEWDYEKQDYTYYQDKEEEQESEEQSILFEETVYESDEEYEDKNKRMKYVKKYMYS